MPYVGLRNLSVASALMLVFSDVTGHPQCLDSRPPFGAAAALPFCGDYGSFGCCTVDDARSIGAVFNSVADAMPVGCRAMAAEIVCLQCSPYAAHLYGLELTGSVSAFPGLCHSHCMDFYGQCGAYIPLLTNDSVLLEAAALGPVAFCSVIRIADEDYCFPDLASNEALQRRVSPQARSTDDCLCVRRVAERLKSPVFVLNANDGTDRLFFGEQRGLVKVSQAGPSFGRSAARHRVFLNITSDVVLSDAPGDERGLLGMAFHPRFSQNRRFFIYYYTQNDSIDVVRVSEMKAHRRDGNKADRRSERILLEIWQPRWNHNGGQLLFGVDGYLYVFVGDGGGAGDPNGNAQDLSQLLGKALRIDVDSATRPYAVPISNPFVGVEGARPEIFAFGLRNPWRCSVDRGSRKNDTSRGRIFCGDVGQNAYEEIDLIVPGGNYGWNAREGFQCYNVRTCGRVGEEQLPIFAYDHTVGKSVTGGYVYRGCESPSLDGAYLFGDYESGRLLSLFEDRVTGLWTAKERHMCESDVCFGELSNIYPTGIAAFGEDENGEVYMACSHGDGSAAPSGQIYKIVDPFVRGNPSECKLQSAGRRVFTKR